MDREKYKTDRHSDKKKKSVTLLFKIYHRNKLLIITKNDY